MASFGEVRQIAYLTDDIEQCMKSWVERSGVGPFTWYQNFTMPTVHNGEESEVLLDVGIAFRGEMQIELIGLHFLIST